MLPVVLALQAVVAVQVIQALALLLGVGYLAVRLKAHAAESRRRERAQARVMAAQLGNLEAMLRASRAETATYLEAVFSGVRGLASNLDAARTVSAQTLEEVRQNAVPAAPERESPDPDPDDSDDSGRTRTLDDARPVEVVRLREVTTAARTRSRRRGDPG